jgi:hypothetical protein
MRVEIGCSDNPASAYLWLIKRKPFGLPAEARLSVCKALFLLGPLVIRRCKG